MSCTTDRFLFIKHSENWNVDRCTQWMAGQGKPVDWCYPVNGQPFPDPAEYAGVVIFGGSNSANDCGDAAWVRDELAFIERLLTVDTPLFGICLGAQMLARVLGASVRPHPESIAEIGFCTVNPTAHSRDFLKTPLTVMQWHTEGFDLPPGTTCVATADAFPNQAFQLNDKVHGVQFHPEVNAAVLAIWHERNRRRKPHQLTDQQRSEMMRDALAHDRDITAWLGDFLSRWTGTALVSA